MEAGIIMSRMEDIEDWIFEQAIETIQAQRKAGNALVELRDAVITALSPILIPILNFIKRCISIV